MTEAIGVIGAGYLGITHAACMAELGFDVVALDNDVRKVHQLQQGFLPIFEPGLAELLDRHISSGRLRFTTDPAEVAAVADVHFICVGTPQLPGRLAADTSQVFMAVESLAPHLARPTLLVGKSTVPVGTAAALQDVARVLAPGVDVEVAWNPEFLREGQAVNDTLEPDRLVFGVASASAEKTLRAVYDTVLTRGTPLVVTDLATAELVKVAANAFLATKISFANAMADMCDAAGGDVVALSEAMGHDARIGHQFLRAGLGFGGGCLPKDVRAVIARAEELGVDVAASLLRQVDAINRRRRHRLVEIAVAECGGSVNGKRVAILGAAFKPQTDDIRDSPALEVAVMLRAEGARVAVFDPQAGANAAMAHPQLHIASSIEDAVRDADLLLHLTEWPEFREIRPETLLSHVRHARVIDGRNALDADLWRTAGWRYRGIGRPLHLGGDFAMPVPGPDARRQPLPTEVPHRRVSRPSATAALP